MTLALAICGAVQSFDAVRSGRMLTHGGNNPSALGIQRVELTNGFLRA